MSSPPPYKDFPAKKDEDKSTVKLIRELESLRNTNSQLKEIIGRYERIAMSKNMPLDDIQEELEVQRALVDSFRDKIQGYQEERDTLGEELEVQIEELRVSNDELLKATELLKESEERFRNLADNIPNLAWMAKPDGWIFWYNKQWYDYTGTTWEDMQGWGWLKVHRPDYVQKVNDRWRSSIEAGRQHENISPLRGKDGNYRWFLTRAMPIKDEQGNIQFWCGTNTDITERIQTEEALKDSKQQAELYVDLMGHDINNMNHAVMGFLELALMTLETEKKLKLEDKLLIERPLAALQTSSKLIDNVRKLQWLMKEGVKTKPVDLGEVLKEIEEGLLNFDGRDVVVNIPTVQHSMVEANELLREVFLNLITNAVKHSDDEKPLTINVTVEPVQNNGSMYYRCVVEDNGPGIPDELKDNLFNRFKKGATMAHGKGLGLYLVRTLVEGYHGRVWVEDRVKGDHTKGARFVVMLPAVINH